MPFFPCLRAKGDFKGVGKGEPLEQTADSLKHIYFRQKYIWKLKSGNWFLIYAHEASVYPQSTRTPTLRFLTLRFPSEVKKAAVATDRDTKTGGGSWLWWCCCWWEQEPGKKRAVPGTGHERRASPGVGLGKCLWFTGVQAKETEITQENKEVSQDSGHVRKEECFSRKGI